MKPLLLLLLLLIAIKCRSQDISATQLISFRHIPFDKVNDVLISKGWSYYNTEKDTIGFSTTSWCYQPEEPDLSGTVKAVQWFDIIYVSDWIDAVTYRFSSKKTFKQF